MHSFLGLDKKKNHIFNVSGAKDLYGGNKLFETISHVELLKFTKVI